MSVIMKNKDIPSNSIKEAGTSCEGLSLVSLRMQGQVPGGHNQATMNKIPLNADNENNVMVLGEKEQEDLFGNSMKITSFNGFHVNHRTKMISILTTSIRKDKHGQRHCMRL